MLLTLLRRRFYLFTILFPCVFLFGQADVNFKHLIPQYNNKSVFVTQTIQDSLGNIWMSSNRGILKYNGYGYQLINKKEVFKDITDEDFVSYLTKDEHNNIWIKSNNGLLSSYNTSKGEFHDISSFLNEPISVFTSNKNAVWIVSKSGSIYCFKEDEANMVTLIPNIDGVNNKAETIEFCNNQEVYISTSKGKIYNYSINTKTLKELIGPFTDYPTPIKIKADNNGKLWIGTETFGLLIYDIKSKTFIQETLFKNNPHNIEKELFSCLFLDSNNFIWGGTDGDGLYKINSETGKITVFTKDNFNKFSISSNTIIDINEDSSKNIWIVNKHGEINVIPKRNQNVKYLKGSANNIPLSILSILKTNDNKLWLGTDGNGLTMIDETTGLTEQYFNSKQDGYYVQSLCEDKHGNIWFGTYKNGLWKYNVRNKKFKKIPVINDQNQKATDVRTVYTDSKNRIWVGSNVAISIFSSNEELIENFSLDNKGLDGIIAESIIEDNANTLWFGISGGGLFNFKENHDNISNSHFKNFKRASKENTPSIKSMCIGEPNKIYLIDSKGKLLLFNIETKKFETCKNLENTEGFSSILSTDPYNFWLSSSNGIYHLDRKKNIVKTYYTSDGFQKNSFVLRSAFKDHEGMLYFGINEGVNFFDPEKLSKKKGKAKLAISTIEVLNKPAKDLLPDQIDSDVFNLEQLILKNNQSSFSIKFSAIENILNPNYYYKYMLSGFDLDWITTYDEGLATYTNIPPGEYSFDIKTYETNNPILISEKKLKIIIEQPFWKSPVAYFLYFLLLLTITFGVVKWFYLRKKLLINKISRRKEKELYDVKMNFFAKMSHEIQTPITLILGPIEDMLKRAELNGNLLLKERLDIISSNAKRLSRIAKELTLTRNKELNKLNLSVTQNNLYNDVTKVCLSFKELARTKKIDFSVNCPKNLLQAWYDKEKVEHIFYNLLSNAFKFTPQDGNVQLTVTPVDKKKAIKITVSDSGQGINEEELKNIFKIFYRSKHHSAIKGMGIGLALTKELVNLHRGKIKVKSTPGEGASFTVKLPIAEENYKDQEKITSSDKNLDIEYEQDQSHNVVDNAIIDKSQKTILIVEDNYDLQLFVKNLLHSKYNILLAENGKEGFYYAKNNIPDLIISDIMMPEMDGIEMCKELNKNKVTSHIPVILLTAKNSTNAKIEGLKTGAIEFINKPFNTKELILKVNNILMSKENIISKYRKELIKNPKIDINQSQDEMFLEKLTSIVNERLKDPSFKVDELADALSMSYSSLYRKCSSITGMNLIDFVRNLRLKKAAILLVKYGYNISQVAYMVGFNDPKYFTKSFKNHFSLTPKEFRKKANLRNDISDFLKEYNISASNIQEEIIE